MQQIVMDALTYWEGNAEQYAGYPIEYEYQANATDPDVEIIVVERILDCGQHTGEKVAGCAHLVTDSAPEPATIRIVDGYRKEWMTTTLKHEIGHTLGLHHSDEPLHIMSDDIEDRIPDYQQRQEALTAYTDAFQPFERGTDHWATARTAWSNSEFVTAENEARNAADQFLEAQQKTKTAKDTARILEETTAYELLDETEKKIEAIRLAAEDLVQMAQEAQKTYGDPEPYRKSSNEHLDDYNQYTFPQSGDVNRAFGFPTKE